MALHGSFLSIILSESLLSKVGLYFLKWACAFSSGSVQSKDGMCCIKWSCPRWVCPDLSRSLLSKVGLYSVLSKVALSCFQWVWYVQGRSVLSLLDLSSTKWVCPKWVCPVQEGSVLLKVCLSCPRWVCPPPSGSDLSKVCLSSGADPCLTLGV